VTTEVLENKEYSLKDENYYNHFEWCIIINGERSKDCIIRDDEDRYEYRLNQDFLELCDDLFGRWDKDYKIASSPGYGRGQNPEIRIFCHGINNDNLIMLKLRYD